MTISKYLPILSTLLFMGNCAFSQQKQPTKRPNILFIFPDQMRRTAMGHVGLEPVHTPNLDQLAKQGMNFRYCGSSYPVCSPFRGMLMSGQYSWNNGVVGNCQSVTAPYGVELKTNTICWSDVLAKNGYSLGYIGKWHLDAPYKPYINCGNNRGRIAWNEWCPPERRHGFTYWHAYGTYDNHMNPLYWTTNAQRNEFKFVNEYGPKYEVDRAIDFLENKDGTYRNNKQPWAMVISMNPPHTGYECVPQKYKDLYKNLDIEALCAKLPNVLPKDTPNGKFFRQNVRNYYAQCTAVDEQVGRLMQYLKEKQYDKNTIIIFTSDHGDCMGMNNYLGKNYPMETCMSVPCLISWPEQIKPSLNNDCFVSPPDFAPTILGLAGLSKAIPQEWDGYNLAPHILGKPTAFFPDGQLYIFMTNGSHITTKEDLYRYGRRGWRNKEWIYSCEVFPDGKQILELYNLKDDPFQLNNIAEKNPQQVKILHERMLKALKEFKDFSWNKK